MAYVESTIREGNRPDRGPGRGRQDPGRGALACGATPSRHQLATPDHVAWWGPSSWPWTGRLAAIDEYFARLAQVTSADVQRVARTYFTPQKPHRCHPATGSPVNRRRTPIMLLSIALAAAGALASADRCWLPLATCGLGPARSAAPLSCPRRRIPWCDSACFSRRAARPTIPRAKAAFAT